MGVQASRRRNLLGIVPILLTFVAVAAAEPSTVVPLTVSRSAVPGVGLSYIQTSGSLPQVSGRTGLTGVNRVLRNLVVSDLERFRAEAVTGWAYLPPIDRTNVGYYETSVNRRFVSASTSVVSVLLPVTDEFPLGITSEFWLSRTIDVQSARWVSLGDMFTNRASGLRAVARLAERKILAPGTCARLTSAGLNRPIYSSGWSPVASNYKTFALTANGITIGFDQGAVAAEGCGSVEVLVPYKPVLPHMNAYGKRLVSGVRQARMK